MSFIHHILCSFVLACVLMTPTSALAQGNYSKEELAEARELFTAGVALSKDGRYVEACTKFEASLQKVDGLGTRGKLAECYEKVGRIASAWKMYRSIQDLARLAGDELRERVSRQRADEIEPRLSYLIVEAKNIAQEKGVAIEDNGILIAPERWGSRIPVDQGRHVVVVFIHGNRLWSKDILLQEAATITITVPKRKTVEPLEVDGPPPSEGQPSPPQATTEPAPLASSPGPVDTQRSNQSMRISGMILVGIGTASILAGVYFTQKAHSLWGEVDGKGCMEDQDSGDFFCDPDSLATSNDARDNATYATYSIGLGLAVVATGGVLWWLSSSRGGSRGGAEEPGVSLSVSDKGAGLWVYGRF